MSENIYKHSCNLYICALHSGRCEIVYTSPRLIKEKRDISPHSLVALIYLTQVLQL